MSSESDINFTSEKIRDVLKDLLKAFNSQENLSKLEEARVAAGNDMVKLMRTSFPLVAQIQMDVIQSHGFRGDGEGAVKFILATKQLEKEDPEIARLYAMVQPYFMPSMTATSNTFPPEEAAS